MDELFPLNLAGLGVDELRVLVKELIAKIGDLQSQIDKLVDQNEMLRSENAKLRAELSGKGGPPSFVKPNSPLQQRKKKLREKGEPPQKQQRKKRAQSNARKRDQPTRVQSHALQTCPDCGQCLTGGYVHRRRQVIDIPEHPVEVTEHQIIARYCRGCRSRKLPDVDLSDQVVGQHRLGIRVMSLIGYLRSVCRLPIAILQQLLLVQYGLKISAGEIVGITQTVAKRGQQTRQQILTQIRQSACVHGDETGWRENGINGYLWGLFTPTACYFHRDGSRAGAVPLQLLGQQFHQTLVTDFYAGYNGVNCRHQRCWTHLLRDLHKLKEAHPHKEDLIAWAGTIYALYKEAIDYQQRCRQAQAAHATGFGFNVLKRRDQRREFEMRLGRICSPYLDQKGEDADPRSVLAERMEKFASELFVFVEYPEVPADNNAAERGVRPAVIARKISGGTRSETGSETFATLATLFGTWKLQQHNLILSCAAMIRNAQLPQPVT